MVKKASDTEVKDKVKLDTAEVYHITVHQSCVVVTNLATLRLGASINQNITTK
jgi:hypothetical protein